MAEDRRPEEPPTLDPISVLDGRRRRCRLLLALAGTIAEYHHAAATLWLADCLHREEASEGFRRLERSARLLRAHLAELQQADPGPCVEPLIAAYKAKINEARRHLADAWDSPSRRKLAAVIESEPDPELTYDRDRFLLDRSPLQGPTWQQLRDREHDLRNAWDDPEKSCLDIARLVHSEAYSVVFRADLGEAYEGEPPGPASPQEMGKGTAFFEPPSYAFALHNLVDFVEDPSEVDSGVRGLVRERIIELGTHLTSHFATFAEIPFGELDFSRMGIARRLLDLLDRRLADPSVGDVAIKYLGIVFNPNTGVLTRGGRDTRIEGPQRRKLWDALLKREDRWTTNDELKSLWFGKSEDINHLLTATVSGLNKDLRKVGLKIACSQRRRRIEAIEPGESETSGK